MTKPRLNGCKKHNWNLNKFLEGPVDSWGKLNFYSRLKVEVECSICGTKKIRNSTHRENEEEQKRLTCQLCGHWLREHEKTQNSCIKLLSKKLSDLEDWVRNEKNS